jgi:hypothetical protein
VPRRVLPGVPRGRNGARFPVAALLLSKHLVAAVAAVVVAFVAAACRSRDPSYKYVQVVTHIAHQKVCSCALEAHTVAIMRTFSRTERNFNQNKTRGFITVEIPVPLLSSISILDLVFEFSRSHLHSPSTLFVSDFNEMMSSRE